ncbi:N-6 DNA methylase [Pseudomonas protegens]|uniref:N-6 DNA methylase n=1 Tax=Pseudomonas protegens TaxID=380021 RepID=UPI001F3F863A|nr:N-6 DNA methylase [Pseudomonas protegens]
MPDIDRACGAASSKYLPFVEEIECGIIQRNRACDEREAIKKLVSLDAGVAVEKLIPAYVRSAQGIFFTEESLANRVSVIFSSEISIASSFFDPACGAGNLLLAIAKKYPLKSNLRDTLMFWGGKFGGCDLNENFVLATKLRLIALAAYRHGSGAVSKVLLSEFLSFFKFFEVGDYLLAANGSSFDCLVANPPFGHVVVSDEVGWSSGRTQQAAIFITHILKNAIPGQKVAAILPDVLRSGTRYSKWRDFVGSQCDNVHVDVYGRFSKTVDVDVFFLCFSKKIVPNHLGSFSSTEWTHAFEIGVKGRVRLGDFFTVRVGPVVPHRLVSSEVTVPYLNAKNSPPFGTAENFERIAFKGTLYNPPFVLVRRTSSPSDKKRLVTTLVLEGKPTAIENHLLILSPKDGRVEACIALAAALQGEDIHVQLNEAIRCRHLTTGSLSNLQVLGMGYE